MLNLRTNKKGFTIFFASLITSLTLAIGLAIFDLTTRGLELATTATESQYAIYAADTGAECALYWDSKYGGEGGVNPDDEDGSAFATSQANRVSGVAVAGEIVCNSQDIVAFGTPPGTYVLPTAGWTGWRIQTPQDDFPTDSTIAATTTFWMALGSLTGPCVKVEVGKSGDPSRTNIVSHGYNTCRTSGTRLERTLQVSY